MSTGSKTSGSSSSVAAEITSLANPITFYKSKTGFYPSNSQVWWSMKRPPELGSDTAPKIYLEVFDPSLRYQIGTGNALVAKGHFIVHAFDIDRSAVSGVTGLPVKSSTGARPSATAFYAGRVWYAGVYTAEFNTLVYFSPIIERPDQVGQCYQSEDPTAEDLHDLLASDGGVIIIPEVARVHHMVAYGTSLFIFANNGVWMVSGSQGTGFRADDYSVTKLSGAQTISNMSFVLVDGVPMWWNLSSIQTITVNEQGQFQVQSTTDQTIKTLFQSIPQANKHWAKGAYDPRSKKVYYLYRSVPTIVEADNFIYDSILTIDTRTGAFSPWEQAGNSRVDFKGVFDLIGTTTTVLIEDVFVDTDPVLISATPVTTDVERQDPVESKIKFIIHVHEAGE